MIPVAISTPSLEWYLTRSTGAMALLLLTITVVLGVSDSERWSSHRFPRFVVDSLHRRSAMLAVCFLAVHILTSVLDGFAHISIIDALVPFVGSYRPFWLGLGALAFDLIIAVMIASLLRSRIGFKTWRTIHWLTYASWPIALLHGLGTGSDVRFEWLLLMSIACAGAVGAAVLARVASGWPRKLGLRGTALGGVAGFAVFLALWLPSGPLASDWARRAGTPAALLKHAVRPASTRSSR